MKPDYFYKAIILPCVTGPLKLVAPQVADSPASRVLLMAIAGQESDWAARLQHGGPARSYWQFENGGGVAQLLGIPSCASVLKTVCAFEDITYSQSTIFEAMAWNDTLDCVMARLLLWQDPAKLPEVGDVNGGWNYYNRNWRPGAPRPNEWPTYYNIAKLAVEALGTS